MARTPTIEVNERRKAVLRHIHEARQAGRPVPTTDELAELCSLPPTTAGNHLRWAEAEGYLTVERGPSGERKVRAHALTDAGIKFIGETPDPRDVALQLARAYLPQLPEPLRRAVEAVPA